LLGGDSETNRALALFPLRLQIELDQAADGFGAAHFVCRGPGVSLLDESLRHSDGDVRVPANPKAVGLEIASRARISEAGSRAMSADIITLPGAGLPDRPITESDIDRLYSEAFRDLESGICDCESMEKIAAQEMFSKYTGTDRELVFAVTHVSEMLTALKANYYAAWHGEKQREAQKHGS
jgi:hypothetical protein